MLHLSGACPSADAIACHIAVGANWPSYGSPRGAKPSVRATSGAKANQEWRAVSPQVSTARTARSRQQFAQLMHRGRRGDIVKVLWFDGDGLCLLAKRLERGRFVWPQATSGTVSLSRAQLSMLLEGIDWRAPLRTAEPVMSV